MRNFDGTQAGRDGSRKLSGKKGVLKEIKAECPAKRAYHYSINTS
jgi:hypothetical protein